MLSCFGTGQHAVINSSMDYTLKEKWGHLCKGLRWNRSEPNKRIMIHSILEKHRGRGQKEKKRTCYGMTKSKQSLFTLHGNLKWAVTKIFLASGCQGPVESQDNYLHWGHNSSFLSHRSMTLTSIFSLTISLFPWHDVLSVGRLQGC